MDVQYRYFMISLAVLQRLFALGLLFQTPTLLGKVSQFHRDRSPRPRREGRARAPPLWASGASPVRSPGASEDTWRNDLSDAVSCLVSFSPSVRDASPVAEPVMEPVAVQVEEQGRVPVAVQEVEEQGRVPEPVVDMEGEEQGEELEGESSGAFVLETPQKYQVTPPCMFGRSHVNILAHPDLTRRCCVSPLARAMHAVSYQRQLNRLFHLARQERPGFMVLTGRWNTDHVVDHVVVKALEDRVERVSEEVDVAELSSMVSGVQPAPSQRGVANFFDLERCEPVKEEPVAAVCLPKRPPEAEKEPAKGCWRRCLRPAPLDFKPHLTARRCTRKRILICLAAAGL